MWPIKVYLTPLEATDVFVIFVVVDVIDGFNAGVVAPCNAADLFIYVHMRFLGAIVVVVYVFVIIGLNPLLINP